MEISDLYKIFLQCGTVSTDSRKIAGGELFFALKGENFDGNVYALKALEGGAAYAVVDDKDRFGDNAGDSRLIVVDDALTTLKALARYHREHTMVDGKRLTVIGLTGTNGKTTTKELIRAVLACKYRVTATEGNLNNDIGVPLSLLRIGADTELAVIEMGASHPDDIAALVDVCEPDYGLITNVGKAHLLGFGSFDGVKKAKGQLYDYVAGHGKAVFVNQDDPDLVEMAAGRPGLSVIPYGAGYWGAVVLPSDAAHPFLRMAVPQTPGSEAEEETLLGVQTHLVGAYNAANVLAALAVGLFFGVELEDAIQAVEAYVPANNRSQMQDTGRNRLIIDAYNANPTSMAAALENFKGMQDEKKVLMLGDMRELGTDSVLEHEAVIRQLQDAGFPDVYLVGEEFKKALEQVFGETSPYTWMPSSEALAAYLAEHSLEGAVVLIKGSRGIMMEKVIPSL